MEPVYARFLEAMTAAMEDRKVKWGSEVPPEVMNDLMDLAQEHHVLPMIFEAVYACPAAAAMDGTVFMQAKRSTVHSVMTQAVKTDEFLALNRHLRAAGIRPLVVKGIVCRSLYPKPDCRYSGDEDVLCGEHQFRQCHRAMVDFGMEACAPQLDSYEVPYRNDSVLYIELHKTLFAQDSEIFGDCNRFFEDAFQRAVELPMGEDTVATLHPTDHMLYLILHAFKHFLHSGFGIRQVCDMVLFANAWGSQVDWRSVNKKCRSVRADKFAAALFCIGEKYLNFDPEKAGYLRFWGGEPVDPEPILADLLYGGIYGSADRSRVHSSNMTLNAVAADKKGKNGRGSLLRTIFPPARALAGRFPYLHKMPFLLPVAWICRIFGYLRETISRPAGAAADVIRTGSQRIELLRQYDIID